MMLLLSSVVKSGCENKHAVERTHGNLTLTHPNLNVGTKWENKIYVFSVPEHVCVDQSIIIAAVATVRPLTAV